MTALTNLMPWLSSLVGYVEWILAGAAIVGAVALILIDFPLGTKAWAIAAVFAIAGAAGTYIEWSGKHAASAAFEKFQADAAAAIAAKQAEADNASTAAKAATDAALKAQGKTVTTYETKVVHDAPSTCAPSPAARDASAGLRAIYESATAGDAQAGQKPGAAVQAPKAGGKP